MNFKSNIRIAIAILCALVVSHSAYAKKDQLKQVEKSGFLGDYSKLQPGKKGEAQLLFIEPSAKFSGYKNILMDPIAVYAKDDKSPLHKVSNEELQSMINYLDAAVREQLGSDYKFVDKAGPGTMRLRIAITEAQGANVALNTASSVTPLGLALGGIKKGITGANTGVAKAGVEMELLDAESGKRLAAAVDARAGNKLNSFKKWQAVQEAYDYWALRLKERLAEFRAK